MATPSLPEAAKANPTERDLRDTAYAAVIAAVVVGAVYYGRPLLVPLALSILMAFALAPVVEFLRRIYIGRVLGVIFAVTMAVLVIAGLMAFIGTQLVWLAAELPKYQHNIITKIQSIEGTAANNGLVRGVLRMFNNVSEEIAHAPLPINAAELQSLTTSQSVRAAQPVIIQEPPPTPVEILKNFLGPLLEPLADLTIIVIFVIFILLQKEDMRDRFIMLAGARDLQRTTMAIDDGAARLSRYLLLQTGVNTGFGILVASGLWLIGIPNPALWGLIAGMFRYVPYIGVPIAAILPMALSIAVDPGWTKTVETLALFTVMESITGQAIEPWLYGRNMGLSALAVVVAAGFWTFVWGPVGLLLSTPLTMCLVVLGRHVDQLRFLDVMLGDQPPMAPEESFYLRMLAGNGDEAAEQAEIFMQDHGLPAYFDEVAVKGLALAQLDVNRNALTEEGRKRIATAVEIFIDNLAVLENAEDREADKTDIAVPPSWQNRPVLCVAGRSVLDHAAASLLAHLLERQGIGARLATFEEVSPSALQDMNCDGVRAICVSYLEPGNPKNARYLARRLRKRMPGLPLIAGFWSAIEDDTQYLDSFEATECDFLAHNLRQAVDQVLQLMKRPEGRFLHEAREEEETVTD
ncbi:MAG: AI-2E family transporter [Alphaproteobacteria bacterium]|nr:AI-2E family transporter [Alphaproteobacteria bacterium]MBV9541704.1 AI-2E family transporter [Alphaproteobacteria bacterium]MBV9905464.1 AI-2E family transporter [Alphaproteobacteria bacterium]